MRQVWVTVSVPEEVGGRIRLGQMGEVRLDALPGRTFTGKVTQVNPSADPASRQFSVRLTLDNPDFTIRPGTFAHVSLQTEVVHDALVVPREAVQHDRDGDYVLVIDDQSVVQHRPVTLGVQSVAVIAITSGLRPGEKVVTLTAYPLKDGQAVSTGGEKSGKSGRSHGR
jgi:membrane fusion protein (multidrug efflux system)